MYVGSLFSGIGGIELGFEREGFETKWFVEKDPFCQAILQKNFPNKPIYGDISTIQWESIEHVDILTGGFPCQDVSYAGKRKGMAGERTGLWKEYARAIREIRPRYAVIENVPGLISLGLDEVITSLAEIGYDAEWTTLRASDFGALHRRERIFIIAYPSIEHGSPERPLSRKQSNIQGSITPNYSSAGQLREEQLENNRESKPRKSTTNLYSVPKVSKAKFVTDDWGQRVQRFREETLQGEHGFSWCKDIRSIEDLKERPSIPQPLFRGTRDGIPDWTHRIKSIGNAVVPQCGQFIARQIKEKEGEINK